MIVIAQRQLDGKGGALADHALDTDAPAVLLDDLPADAQAQSGAAVAVLVRLFGGVERLENEAKLIRSDADAAVGDAHLGHVGTAGGAGGDAPPPPLAP